MTLTEGDEGRGPERRIRDYFRRYWVSFALGIACLIITQAFALSVPQLLRIATDALVTREIDGVKTAALWLVAVSVLGALMRIASRVLIFNAGRRVEFDIRNDCFTHLQREAPSFYREMPLAQVMSRLVNDLTQVRLLLGPGLLNLTNTTLVYLVVIPLLFLTDPELAFFSLLPLPLLLLLGRVFARHMYNYSKEAQDRLGTLSARVQENLSGVMTVRAYRREDDERRRFLELNDRYLEVNLELARLRGVMFPLMGLAGAIGSVVVLYMGGHRIAAGTMSVGQFVQFSAYLAALTWPTIALGWMISLLQRGFASMDRVNDIFRAQPTIVDGAQAPSPFAGRLVVQNLTYSHGEGSAPALQDVSFAVEPGEMVVIVGRTGSGKSTLLQGLARLLELPPGTVYLDGRDVTELPLEHVRRRLGYAPQDAFLFSRTLFENVAFGDPEATEERVREALRIAAFDTDVAAFPEGLDTVVGERGITLSGGQRQRATLARAILIDPEILLLDDTLSAVDTETETKILAALSEAKRGRTLIMATHRLACAAKADRILVFDEGRLIEQGSEPELLARGGVYAEMHRRQRLRQALEQTTKPPSDRAERSDRTPAKAGGSR